MTIALSILALFAIVTAIGAASRVQRQIVHPQPSRSSLQEPSLSATSKTQLEPDRDVDRAIDDSPKSQPSPADQWGNLERLQSNISLAGSLSVSEVIHPSEVEPSIFVKTAHESAIAGLSSHDQTTQSNSLLQEVAELAPGGHKTQISHLAHYLNHADSVMRAAAAFALGDLAPHCHGEDLEKIFSILQQFSQDANPQVRLQAVTALANLKPSDLFSE
ncbi:MAG: HEAT repeat domain-containing protein [Candidatus Parcubacteria bacterium]|nr:HEAT repeat domain-containing protein [Leptolyngbyaceae cyanobacterium LF-bin-113]